MNIQLETAYTRAGGHPERPFTGMGVGGQTMWVRVNGGEWVVVEYKYAHRQLLRDLRVAVDLVYEVLQGLSEPAPLPDLDNA